LSPRPRAIAFGVISSSSVSSSWVEMWSIGRTLTACQRGSACLRLLPQGWNVCRTAGCFSTKPANSLNSATEPRSDTPKKVVGYLGTSVFGVAEGTRASASAEDSAATSQNLVGRCLSIT
jgi:hypothetical protein